MRGRRLPSLAVGVFRLLLEQQAKHAPSQLRNVLLAEGATPTLLTHGCSTVSSALAGQLQRQLWPAAAVALQPQVRLFHAAGWQWQQPQPAAESQQPAAAAIPKDEQLPGGEAKPAPPALPDAEECDEAITELEDTRRRVRALSRPPPGHIPLGARVKTAVSAVGNGLVVGVKFVVGLPGRVGRFYMLPRAERRATYAGWWAVVKKEAKHYWVGTKLLGKEVRIAARLVKRVLQGKTLSRRERQQLTRTTADIFRLVPFAVFVIVPFMELLLPVALKLFPNMLPSTFEDKLKKEEEMKRRIHARLGIARFLQETVTEMAVDMQKQRTGETATSAAELYRFMQKVRAGEEVSTQELLKFAKLFNDELTLDNLERVQLVSLCRFVGIQPFGTDAFLRSRLRAHLREIKADDREIQDEGLDSLTEDELRQACRARGMRAPFGEGAAAFMRHQLGEWLDWSLNRSLPSSLLLLSRAFTVTAPIGGPKKPVVGEDTLREAISTLPDEAVEDVEVTATASRDLTEAYEKRLELLEREEEMIREEEEERLLAEELPVTASAHTAAEMTAAAAAAAVVREAAAGAVADMLDGESAEERSAKVAAAKEARMRKVISALAALASTSGVSNEREAFMELVEKEIDRLEGQLEKRGVSMLFSRGSLQVSRPDKLEEVVAGRRLADRVSGILQRIEKELDDADSKIGDSMRVLDLDNDGIITTDELQTAMSFLREQLGEEELRHMLETLRAEGEGASGEAAGSGYGQTRHPEGINVNKLMQLAGVKGEAAEEGTPPSSPRSPAA
ncbi:hypothetical protein N2152v2_005143 [Parachlorella kessleri]